MPTEREVRRPSQTRDQPAEVTLEALAEDARAAIGAPCERGEAVPQYREAERRRGDRSREDLDREQCGDQQVRRAQQVEALVIAKQLAEEAPEPVMHATLVDAHH